MTESIADRCVAAHELGHAFAGREGGLTPGRLTVRNGEGRCVWVENEVPGSMFWATAVAMGGGQAAERLYCLDEGIECPPNYGTGADEQAFGELAHVALPADGWPTGATFAMAVREAEALILRVWHELIQLVVPLAVNGRLDHIPR